MLFCNHLLKNLIQTFAGSAVGSAYHGTVRQKRETAIPNILRACGSEWIAKLVDVQCFADIIESWFSLGLGGTSNSLVMSIDVINQTKLPRVSSNLSGNVFKDTVMGILQDLLH